MINALNKDIRLFTLQDSVGAAVDYLHNEEISAAFVVENELY